MAYRTVGVRVARVPEITCFRCGQTTIPDVIRAEGSSQPPFELECRGWNYPERWIRFELPELHHDGEIRGHERWVCAECAPIVATTLTAAVVGLDRSQSSVTDADPDGPGEHD